MKRKLAIIHTTPVTVDALKSLAIEIMPDCEVVNIVDDSILPELNAGGKVEDIADRWRQYAHIAENIGADCILGACSSIGELVPLIQPEIKIPIVRIDDAMAEFAVSNAAVIGVAATLGTTLAPTTRLLEAKAKELGKTVELKPMIASAAYQKLMAGDKEGHDKELAEALRSLAKETELVVLAQASMARVLPTLSDEERSKFVTSPKLGMERVKQTMQP